MEKVTFSSYFYVALALEEYREAPPYLLGQSSVTS